MQQFMPKQKKCNSHGKSELFFTSSKKNKPNLPRSRKTVTTMCNKNSSLTVNQVKSKAQTGAVYLFGAD